MRNTHNKGSWTVVPTPETISGGDFQARIIAFGALSDGADAIVVGHHANKNGSGNIHWPANAYLIAAAPDLLAACKQFIDLDERLFRNSLDEHQLEVWDSRIRECIVAIMKSTVPSRYSITDDMIDLSNLPDMDKPLDHELVIQLKELKLDESNIDRSIEEIRQEFVNHPKSRLFGILAVCKP